MTIFNESSSGALVAQDGLYPVTLLTPGLGASAFYSEDVIARDAGTAFPKGTHVYLNHLPEGETRDPAKLLGVLAEPTQIRESDGAATNMFRPMAHWAAFVEEVAPYVGLSINASGSAKAGTLDGKVVKFAESIDYSLTNSVDMVSYAGREGSGFAESLIESAINTYRESHIVQPEPSEPGSKEEDNKMELEESVATLTSKVDTLVTLMTEAFKPAHKEELDVDQERVAVVEAVRVVESAEVPASVKSRLIEGIKVGNLDVKSEIDATIALTEEIRLQESAKHASAGAAGADGASGSALPTVKGWGN